MLLNTRTRILHNNQLQKAKVLRWETLLHVFISGDIGLCSVSVSLRDRELWSFHCQELYLVLYCKGRRWENYALILKSSACKHHISFKPVTYGPKASQILTSVEQELQPSGVPGWPGHTKYPNERPLRLTVKLWETSPHG